MNALWDWLTLPLVGRFGWALVHFVWQGAALGVGAALVLAAMRRARPAIRYAVCCTALACMVVAPVLTFLCTSTPRTETAGVEAIAAPAVEAPAPAGGAGGRAGGRAAAVAMTADEGVVETVPAAEAAVPAAPPAEPWAERWADRLEDDLPWLVAAWAAGVLVLTVRLLGGWLLLQRVRRSGVAEGCDVARAALDRLGGSMAVRRAVQVGRTALAHTPIVVGWLKPVILLPPCMLTGLGADELMAVLAHELAHIRRHDYLVNLLQSAAVTLLFYHPAVHWVSHRLRLERELCCDEEAARAFGDRVAYARALARAEEVRRVPALAMGLGRTPLLERVRHLLGIRPAGRRPTWAAGLSTAALVLAITLGLGVFQARLAHAAPLTLHQAAEFGDLGALRQRLREGADVNALDDDGMTPLHCAAEAGQAYAARLLVRRGAMLEARGRALGGRTPLHVAAESGHPEVCAVLLDAGADVEARDGTGNTPLISAAFSSQPETVRLLLERGADVNAHNEWIWTALHCAAQKSATEVARILLDHGIVATVESNQGETAMDRAGDCGSVGIIAMLTPDTPETLAAKKAYGLPGKVLVMRGAGRLRPLYLHVVEARTGDPVGDATVGFLTAMGKCQTDADGRVVVPVSVEGGPGLVLDVTAPGMAPVRLQWPGRDVPQTYRLEMATGMPFGGVVRDRQGRPVRGAKVTVSFSERLSPVETSAVSDHTETTDVAGRWSCDLASGGLDSVQVSVSDPDYLPTEPGVLTGAALERLLGLREITVLERGWRPSGAVLDDKGLPLAGAAVTRDATGWRNPDEVLTDSGGRFRFPAGPAGKHVLMARSEGHSPGLIIVDAGPRLKPVEFRLGPGHTIRGKVVDAAGDPLPGAWVVAMKWRGYAPKLYRSPADAQGRFEWDAAPADPVGFQVWHPDGDQATVTMQAREEPYTVTLTAPPPAPPQAKAGYEVRLYAVQDLVAAASDTDRAAKKKALIDLIRQSCGEGTWLAQGGGLDEGADAGSLEVLQADAGVMAVRQTPAVHQCIDKLLAELRKSRGQTGTPGAGVAGPAQGNVIALRIYPIRDLVTQAPGGPPAIRIGDLLDLIRQSCGEGPWPAGSLGVLPTDPGSLAVRQTPQVQECIEKLLKDLRATRNIRVRLEVGAYLLLRQPEGPGYEIPAGLSVVNLKVQPSGEPAPAVSDLAGAARWHVQAAPVEVGSGQPGKPAALEGLTVRPVVSADRRYVLLEVDPGVPSAGRTVSSDDGATDIVYFEGDAARTLARRWMKPDELAGLDLAGAHVALTLRARIEVIEEHEQREPATGPRPATEQERQRLMGWVEDFFKHNFRDITARDTIEWADAKVLPNGDRSIRYKYRATIWGKDQLVYNFTFTFDANGQFVSIKDVPTAAGRAAAAAIRTYDVDKAVSDFPEKEDLSTPEAAYATLNRLAATGDQGFWRRLSDKDLRAMMPASPPAMAVPEDWKAALLGARILFVQTCGRDHAAVTARLAGPGVRQPIDARYFTLEDGRWLNAGNNRFDTEKEAKQRFADICARREYGTQSTASAPAATFGPVIERTVPRSDGGAKFVDLDIGRVCAVPEAVASAGRLRVAGWARAKGIDGRSYVGVAGPLMGIDVILSRVHAGRMHAWWDDVTAQQVVDNALQGAAEFVGDRAQAGDVYSVLTAAGSMGILQVLEPTDGSQELTLRYRMVAPLPDDVLKKRDEFLAAADRQIREGLVSLADRFPALRKARGWDQMGKPSETGRLAVGLSRSAGIGKGGDGDVPEEERFSVLVLVEPPTAPPGQLATWSLFPHLRLAGQTGARAADPELAAALKKLVDDALKPLQDYEQELSGSGSVAGPQRANVPLYVERTYDVGDLLPGSEGQNDPWQRAEGLMELIRQSCGRGTWGKTKADGIGWAQVAGSDPQFILIRQTEKVHQSIEEVLASLRSVRRNVPVGVP